jgi:hypothetical protein
MSTDVLRRSMPMMVIDWAFCVGLTTDMMWIKLAWGIGLFLFWVGALLLWVFVYMDRYSVSLYRREMSL